MAMINCRECNHHYSSRHKQCPECNAYTNPADGELTAGERAFKAAMEKQNKKEYSVEFIKKANKQMNIALCSVVGFVVIGTIAWAMTPSKSATTSRPSTRSTYTARSAISQRLCADARDNVMQVMRRRNYGNASAGDLRWAIAGMKAKCNL